MTHLNLPRWVRSLRLIVGVTCLCQLALLWLDRDTTLYTSAVVHPEFIDAWAHSSMPTLYDIATTAAIADYNGLVRVVLLCYGLSILGLFFDKTCNACAILVAVLHAIVFSSIEFFTYGVDQYMSICCFYLAILGVFGVLNHGKVPGPRTEKDARLVGLVLLFLQWHIALAYCYSGIDKVVGYNWRNGESVWKALHLVNNPTAFSLNGLAGTPAFLIAGWGTVLLELTYVLWVRLDATRLYAALAMILFHAAIGIFLGLYVFAAFLIAVNACLFIVPYSRTGWFAGKILRGRNVPDVV